MSSEIPDDQLTNLLALLRTLPAEQRAALLEGSAPKSDQPPAATQPSPSEIRTEPPIEVSQISLSPEVNTVNKKVSPNPQRASDQLIPSRKQATHLRPPAQNTCSYPSYATPPNPSTQNQLGLSRPPANMAGSHEERASVLRARILAEIRQHSDLLGRLMDPQALRQVLRDSAGDKALLLTAAEDLLAPASFELLENYATKLDLPTPHPNAISPQPTTPSRPGPSTRAPPRSPTPITSPSELYPSSPPFRLLVDSDDVDELESLDGPSYRLSQVSARATDEDDEDDIDGILAQSGQSTDPGSKTQPRDVEHAPGTGPTDDEEEYGIGGSDDEALANLDVEDILAASTQHATQPTFPSPAALGSPLSSFHGILTPPDGVRSQIATPAKKISARQIPESSPLTSLPPTSDDAPQNQHLPKRRNQPPTSSPFVLSSQRLASLDTGDLDADQSLTDQATAEDTALEQTEPCTARALSPEEVLEHILLGQVSDGDHAQAGADGQDVDENENVDDGVDMAASARLVEEAGGTQIPNPFSDPKDRAAALKKRDELRAGVRDAYEAYAKEGKAKEAKIAECTERRLLAQEEEALRAGKKPSRRTAAPVASEKRSGRYDGWDDERTTEKGMMRLNISHEHYVFLQHEADLPILEVPTSTTSIVPTWAEACRRESE